jgi:hypothetical protein
LWIQEETLQVDFGALQHAQTCTSLNRTIEQTRGQHPKVNSIVSRISRCLLNSAKLSLHRQLRPACRSCSIYFPVIV